MATSDRRLLWLVPYAPWPADHGGKIRASAVLRRLAERGWQIDVWLPAPRDDNAPPPPTLPGVTFHHFRTRARGHRLTKVAGLLSRWPLSAWTVHDRRSARQVRHLANAYAAVVLDQSYQAPWVRGLARTVPVVLVAHNIEHQLVRQMAVGAPRLLHRLLYRLDAGRFERMERALFARADLIMVVSERDKAYLLDDPAVRPDTTVTVRPNGVDLAAFPLRERHVLNARTMLMTGTLGYPPNHDAALWIHTDVLPRVRASIPDACIKLVGSLGPRSLKALHNPAAGFNVVGYVRRGSPVSARG